MKTFEILYQDEAIIAIHKPEKWLVHKSALSQDRHFVLNELRNQVQKKLFPVHRLDRATSGVLLFCFQSETARILADAFQNHNVQKTYLAIVRGYLDYGILDYDLKHEETQKIQSAITEYQNLKNQEFALANKTHPTSRYSVVKLQPKTGRMHQLRRHMAHLRHPIIGDTKHGDGFHNRLFRNHFSCNRLLLLAANIKFKHPQTQKQITISIQKDSSFQNVLNEFDLELSELLKKI